MNENKYAYRIRYYDKDEGDLLYASGMIDGKDFCEVFNRLCNEYNGITEVHMNIYASWKPPTEHTDNSILN